MNEVEGLIWNTVKSCAALYGFSAEEVRAKIDLNGNLISVVNTNVDKEGQKAEKLRLKECQKAEKLILKEADKALKEAQKAEKLRQQEAEKAEKLIFKEAEKALKKSKTYFKNNEKAEKANESSERTAMKEEEVLSKAVEKAEKLRVKEAEKALKKAEKTKKLEVLPKKTKKIQQLEAQSVVSNDEEPLVLFQNIPLMNEINSICDVKNFKNWKKLSKGVKLARQILDI